MHLTNAFFDSEKSSFWLNGGKYWYVGLENSIDEGIRRFLFSLKEKEEILISEPVIFSFIEVIDDYDYSDGDIHFVIAAQALSKLQYLAYKAKQVNKNIKKGKSIIK